ncbi:hypothetical protein BXY66_4048 [Shimia isoporae]|uniref:Uncharacterized protein n=1 Tax=Shimia isoporae TaxID=647720 RepID=A0A4R1N8I2_9RHOB|nr:hypothetical protein [Shimia isoporae]TCK98983.1 hypothetical protein BXY66_4048 [Shimia isoporae]
MHRFIPRSLVWTVLCGALAGCGQFPDAVKEVDDDITDAVYPKILPNAVALVTQPPRLDENSDDVLEARERRLRRRAAALKQ